MGKVICAINMTLDGYFDHTNGLPDEYLHAYYAELLRRGSSILYGRKTFELMLYWKEVLILKNIDSKTYEFAKMIDAIPKIIFSTTLQNTNWSTAELAKISLIETTKNLKETKDAITYIGSRRLMIQLLESKLLDELVLCVHPVANPSGKLLFEDLENRIIFKQKSVKTLKGGHIVITLRPIY